MTKRKGSFIYYHQKNRPLLAKKPKGCKPRGKGRVIRYPGKDIRIIDCG
jgi:hypothetical protein